MQKFTSSQIPSYVREKERWTNQKSSSPEDGLAILSNTRNLQGKEKTKKLSSYSTFFPGRKTNEIVNEIGESVRRSQKEDGQHFLQKPMSVSVHVNDEQNSDFFNGTERRWRTFSARRGKKCSLLREVEARILHVHWSRFRKDLEFLRSIRWPKRRTGWTGKASYGCVSCTDASNPEKMYQFPERRIEERRCKYAFQRRWFTCQNDDGSQQFSQRLLYCFSEFVIILERLLRLTLKVKDIRLRCSYSKSLRGCHSASTSTLCYWEFLKLCFDSGGKPLSKGITLG